MQHQLPPLIVANVKRTRILQVHDRRELPCGNGTLARVLQSMQKRAKRPRRAIVAIEVGPIERRAAGEAVQRRVSAQLQRTRDAERDGCFPALAKPAKPTPLELAGDAA